MWDLLDALFDVIAVLIGGLLRAVHRVRDGLEVQQRDLRFRRRAAGQCQACGYDLTGNVSGRCPESGRAVAAKRRKV